MTLFQNKLEAINTELKLDKVGVTIQNRRNGLYLRAMLPDKYDPDWTKLKQQRISIRLTAEDTNLIKAKKLALKLSSQKISRLFIWNEWLADEEKLAAQKKSLKISDIYKAFEEDFWSGEVEKTPKKKRNWKSISQYLAPRNKLTKPNSIKLEHHKLLTAEYIISTVKKFKTEKTRFDMMKYCLRLATFAEIPDLKEVKKFSEFLSEITKSDVGRYTCLTADHGVINVDDKNRHKIVYDDSVKIYGDQRSVYINGDMKKIKNIFKNIPGHFLEKQEIESLIGLPNDDERNNFFPEHVFLLDDGHIIFPNHLSANLRGYHGGLTPKEVAIPLIEIVS